MLKLIRPQPLDVPPSYSRLPPFWLFTRGIEPFTKKSVRKPFSGAGHLKTPAVVSAVSSTARPLSSFRKRR